MTSKESITVVCEDGVLLKGLLLLPSQPKAVVQFNCGTAAKKEFYLPFLEFLAENGFICCLWDYRGSGESAPQDLKNCTFHFLDYGTKDMSAIKKYLQQRFSNLPYLLVGHSVGVQQIGFIDDLSGVQGLVAFAVSTGYLPYMPLTYRLLSAYFFYIFTPLSIAFAGYLKAKKYGYMEDLPKNVVLQWRDWCEKPDYFFNKEFYGKTVPIGNFKQYDFPVHVFWTTDDPISNKNSVPAYWNNVKSKKSITLQKITAKDYQVKKIEHFGFFKKNLKPTLWQETLQKLNSFLV
jgi:predicted alpha/beta hydrolase